MAAPDQVPQGTNYDFQFALEGEGLSGFTYTLSAKQYPGGAAAISRTVTAGDDNVVDVTLTPAETAAMAVGLWYLGIESTDSDETLHSVKRIQITKPWI